MSQPKISVLIPVYNVEQYLEESIGSILNQTFRDIELVCVNDGSTDSSLEILNSFASKDSRVRVIDKENGGCGSARNRAIEEASGEYVYFFDPDDILEPNAFELAYNIASENDSDMVIFKANVFDEEGISNRKIFFYYNNRLKPEQFKSFSNIDVKAYVLKGGYAPWSKLYKKEFLDSYDDFKFDLGIAFDDVPFHVKSLVRAKRMSFVNEFLYHYRVDNATSVNSTSSNGFDIFKIIDMVEGILRSEDFFAELEREFYVFKVYHILLYIISTDSEKYFKMAQERFADIDVDYISNVKSLKDGYELVLSCRDFDEFKPKYRILTLEEEIAKNKRAIKKLKRENLKLKKDISAQKKLNDEILNSTSWKATKYLRKLKNPR